MAILILGEMQRYRLFMPGIKTSKPFEILNQANAHPITFYHMDKNADSFSAYKDLARYFYALDNSASDDIL